MVPSEGPLEPPKAPSAVTTEAISGAAPAPVLRFSANFYDGETSRAHPVEISLDAAGVLHVAGLREPVFAPLSQVQVAPRLGDTVRSLAFPGGGRAESVDHAALDQLLTRAGKGAGLRWVHELESRWRWVAIGVVTLALLIVGGVRWGIPIMAERLALALPDALAYDLGKHTLTVLDKTALDPSNLSEARRAELTREFEVMARGYPKLPLNLQFRRGLGANAFALPNGTVVVTDELCELATDDKQVLSVLAHEIGHVHNRHALRIALESSSVAILVSTYLGDMGQITTLSAALPAAYVQAHYSRELETEADTFALDYLHRTGVSPHHFADILRALEKAHGAAEGEVSYLASHPPTAERIQRFVTKRTAKP